MDGKLKICEFLKSCKCCMCDYLLSVPPIMTEGKNNELYKCGRCKKVTCRAYLDRNEFIYIPSSQIVSNSTRRYGQRQDYGSESSFPQSYRVKLFEDIAQHLSFSCSHDGCTKQIPWGRVETHERNCCFRKVLCPLSYKSSCTFVRVNELEQHFDEKHNDHLKLMGSTLEVHNLNSSLFLLKAENHQCFLAYILLKGHVSLFALRSSKKYTRFNVKVQFADNDEDGEIECSVFFENLPIIPFNERLHCFMCHMKKCHEPHHPFSSQNNKDYMKLNSFTSHLKNQLLKGFDTFEENLSYCINLAVDEPTQEDVRPSSDIEDAAGEEAAASAAVQITFTQPRDSLKRIFTCPCCWTCMSAPIHMCSIGHAVCKECKPKLDDCPTCRSAMGHSRNYALEELADEVVVPCQYDYEGCTFVDVASRMCMHELECSFSGLLEE
ncbi:hypothetical protein NQ315_007304 [Exocentrus adspersus]|uniref:RING-type E3 ubiquitin transferase n=1 Tax=Exocentrus adspersus TaxID=1586481 RepID=A0AAV8WFK5_9CUCU|nr:hypothetical protein NQ315_007304 [Exocentrus adspersus]